MELAYVAHSARCALLLDSDGICRWVVPKADASEALIAAARRCVGGHFVASLDAEVEGLLGREPRVGSSMLFACSRDGNVSLARFGPLVELEVLEPSIRIVSREVMTTYDPPGDSGLVMTTEAFAIALARIYKSAENSSSRAVAERPTATAAELAELAEQDERRSLMPATRRVDPSVFSALKTEVDEPEPSTPALANLLEPSSPELDDADATGNLRAIDPAAVPVTKLPDLPSGEFSAALDRIFQLDEVVSRPVDPSVFKMRTDEEDIAEQAARSASSSSGSPNGDLVVSRSTRELAQAIVSKAESANDSTKSGGISSPAVASFLNDVSELTDTPFSEDWIRRLEDPTPPADGSAPALEEILREANERLEARASEAARTQGDESEVELMTGSFQHDSNVPPLFGVSHEEIEQPVRVTTTAKLPPPPAHVLSQDLDQLAAAVGVTPDQRPSGFVRKVRSIKETMPGPPAVLDRALDNDGDETCRFSRAAGMGEPPRMLDRLGLGRRPMIVKRRS